MTTLKRHYFYRVFSAFFHFVVFPIFLFLQHKTTKTKNAIFVSKTSFLTSPQFYKNTILAQCDTFCVFKLAPKTLYKLGGGGTVNKKTLGPVFNFKLGPNFNFKTPKSWTNV